MKLFTRHCYAALTLLCVVLAGCSKPADKPAEAGAKDAKPAEAKQVEIKRNEKGDVILTVTDEAQKRIDLKVDEVKATQHIPELTAYGTVIDPSALVTAQSEISATAVALDTSKKAAARAKSLFEQGENVARKTLETAEADVRANEIKLKAQQHQVALEWGQIIANLSADDSQSLINGLIANKTVLARVDLPTGETISGEPGGARIKTLSEGKWLPAKIVSRATKVDPKTQGESFIVQCESTELRPGAAVSALLQTKSAPQQGVTIPDVATVQFIGKAWAYVQSGTNSFTRQEISLQTPVDGGWFQTNGIKAGDHVVVQGAQELLSEEQKAQITID
jgi:multidrug efflux system membrane fusion protein